MVAGLAFPFCAVPLGRDPVCDREASFNIAACQGEEPRVVSIQDAHRAGRDLGCFLLADWAHFTLPVK